MRQSEQFCDLVRIDQIAEIHTPTHGWAVDLRRHVGLRPALVVQQLLAYPPSLQPGVDGLALEGEHPEHALVHPVERLAGHEPLERLDSEGELAEGQRPLAAEPARAQAGQVASAVYSGP